MWRLCTEVLGFDKLSETFHKPMLDEWDRIDYAAIVLGQKVPDTVDVWPREHIKTWCMRARVIRATLFDPAITFNWWHAVAMLAEESNVAIAEMIQKNKELRRLYPKTGVLPSEKAKRFVQATQMSLNSVRIGDAPTLRAMGAGAEASGAHSRGGVLDDIAVYNDVVDSQMANKRRWYQATVCNVVQVSGFKWAIATRWDRDDVTAMWLKSRYWKATVRACLETDGVMDYKGRPVFMTAHQIAKKREELGTVQFALQMMNDVTHSEERPWKPEQCEHPISLEEAKGPGFKICIMDPAAEGIGGEDFLTEKSRADGSKDNWAIQIWKIRRRGDRIERIWLDGMSSSRWNVDEGMAVGARLMKKWGVIYAMIEDQNPFIYHVAFKRAARIEGIRFTNPLLPMSRMQGKNSRWGALCGRAESCEILVCSSVPDEQKERFLDQARNWIPKGKRNGLAFDDEADCASYVMDPALDPYLPREGRLLAPDDDENDFRMSPFRKKKEEEFVNRTRHLQW